jgi:4-hydroxybenzoate polyprenyltransferase
VRAWLQLLRISLAPTVVADVAAGVALVAARPGELPFALRLAVVPLLLFCGGMALNAFVDREEDARTRPRRPLPSGAITPGAALAVAVVALAAAPAVAWLVSGLGGGAFGTIGALQRDRRVEFAAAAAAIAAAILLYHSPLRRSALLGPLLLGSIRGGDLLLGAVAAGGLAAARSTALPAAIVYASYVAGASFVAHEEDRAPRMAIVRGGVVLAFTAIAANAAFAWFFERDPRLESSGRLGFAALVVAFWHALGARGAFQLFKPGAPGLTPLASYARLLLSRMALVPAVAALGAGAPDLGVAAAFASVLVALLVRFVPPT